MSQNVAIRGLNRSSRIRVTDVNGVAGELSTTQDTVVDLDNTATRRQLHHHNAIGQWIVTATNASSGVAGSKSALPANS